MSITTVETLLHRIVLILTSPSFYNPLLQKVQLFRYIISCLRALTFPRGQALWRQEQKKLLPQAKEITFSCVSSLHNKTFFSFFQHCERAKNCGFSDDTLIKFLLSSYQHKIQGHIGLFLIKTLHQRSSFYLMQYEGN